MDPSIYSVLDTLSIDYEKIDHPPVYTSEQARQLVPVQDASSAKNLFLKDKKGKHHYLLVFDDQKDLNMKELALQIGTARLSLSSISSLKQLLGVDPGGVSLLALINDPERRVQLLIDREIWEKKTLQCHPLVNNVTLVISMGDIKRFLEYTGHIPTLVEIP